MIRWVLRVAEFYVAYRFGRWVKEADLVMAHFNDRNEIERLRARIVELEEKNTP